MDVTITITTIICFLVIIVSSIALFYKEKQMEDRFDFERSPFSNSNYSKAVIVLGCHLERVDRQFVSDKLDFIRIYIQTNFTDYGNVENDLVTALQLPLTVEQCCLWLKRHDNDFDDQLLLKFLKELAEIDGELTQREINLIEKIRILLAEK